MSTALIKRVEIAAAHDGVAELIVTLEFKNGGQSLVTLDEFAAHHLMKTTGTSAPEELTGTPWEHVRDALSASSKRYQTQTSPDQRTDSHV